MVLVYLLLFYVFNLLSLFVVTPVNLIVVIFCFLAILPTRGHMIDFLANLAFNLAPKTHQNSIQEASKIDQTGYRKYDASWLGIWTPLGTDLGGFWRQVGRQVGPKLTPKSGKLGSQDDIKKMIEKRRREVIRYTPSNPG